MKLLYNHASPYARKVRVAAHESGTTTRFEAVDCGALSPVSPNDAVVASNPVGKIPTMVLDDGTALFDSRVICEFLDSLGDADKLFPSDPDVRWRTLTHQALGDGILDAAILLRYETALRPEPLQWPEWIDGQMLKVHRGLAYLESEALRIEHQPDIGSITAACALGYLDFRFPEQAWRNRCPKLADWYTCFAARDSMQATEPR